MKNRTKRKVFTPSKPWEPRKSEDVACWAVVDEMNVRLGWVKTITADIYRFLVREHNDLLAEGTNKGLK